MTLKISQLHPGSTKTSYRNQSGLSLIELMISTLVGLFLLAGVVTNFVGTRSSDKNRNAISEMDANANAAFSVLRQAISHAGYSSIENIPLDKPFYTTSDGTLDNPICRDGSNRDILQPAFNRSRTRDVGKGDRLTVISMADNPCRDGLATCPGINNVNPAALVYTDCTGGGATRGARAVSCSTDPTLGMDDPRDAKIYSTFRLRTAQRELRCEGSRGGSQPIVDNVEAIQYLYGVQLNGNTVYRSANQVENNNQWGLVKSVQVGLLMRSSSANILKVDSTTTFYTVLNRRVNIASRDLKRLFRVYTTTINLENKNKGKLL